MSAYEPLKYSPTVSPDLSTVPASENIYESASKTLSTATNALDQKLQYYQDQNDKTYVIQQSADFRIKADDLFHLHTDKISEADLNPDREGFKDIGSKALESFDADLEKALEGKKPHIRNQIRASVAESKLHLTNRIKEFKVEAIKQNIGVRFDTLMKQTDLSLSRDGSDKNYQQNKKDTHDFIDASHLTTAQKIKQKKDSNEKLAIQQADSISKTNPLLLWNWHRHETSKANSLGEVKPVAVKDVAGSNTTAPTPNQDTTTPTTDTAPPKKTESLSEAIDSAVSKEEDIKPVTLEEMNQKRETLPFKGWEDLSPENRHKYLHQSIGVASKSSKENRASADKFLKDAEVVIEHGGTMDFNNPAFTEESIRSHFPKNADDILEKIDVLRYVSKQNEQFIPLSLTQGQDYLAKIKPPAGSSAQDWRKFEKTEKAFHTMYQKLATNPLEWALNNNIANVQRLYIRQPQTWGEEIKKRFIAKDVMRGYKGVDSKILDEKDIQTINEVIGNLKPRDAGAFMQNLSSSTGGDTRKQKMLNEALKESDIGSAMPYITAGDHETAIRVIDGSRILKKQDQSDPTGKFSTAEKGFYDKFSKLFERGFNQIYGSDRADLKNTFMKATKAILASDAYASHESIKTHEGSSTKEFWKPNTWFDDSNVEKAFDRAVGGKMQKVGGSYVVGVRGMSDSDFRTGFMDRAVESLSEAGVLANTSGGESYARVYGYQYYEHPERKNVYGVLGPARTALVNPKTGEPVLVDFNKPASPTLGTWRRPELMNFKNTYS